jgi:hypothetical protein
MKAKPSSKESAMNSPLVLSASLLVLVFLGGCSSSGGGSGAFTGTPGASTVMVKTYYDAPTNTLLQEEGLVLMDADGKPTDIKHGQWRTYFSPADGNGLKDEMVYVRGVWDQADFWTSFNPDSSIRDAMIDGVY